MINREPVAPWLRALGIDAAYLLSCDNRRLADFRRRHVDANRPFGNLTVWQVRPDVDGERGCRLGHQAILEDAISSARTSVLVLEDDVIWHPQAVHRIMEGVLWVQGHDKPAGIWLGGRAISKPPIGPGIVKGWPVWSTHGFILNGDWIARAAEALSTDAPADRCVMSALRRSGQVYTLVPAALGQAGGYSYVEDGQREERW